MAPRDAALVVQHYERLARSYDRRWQAYLRSTLGALIGSLRLTGSERILDVGCGTGELARLARERFPRLDVVGLDMTPGMLAVAREKGATVLLAHAEALPLQSATADVVVSANALHHLASPQRFMEECRRVLRPGGRVALVDWCRDFWHCRLMHHWLTWVDPAYVAMYRLAEIRAIVESCGFVVQGARRFLAPPAYGLFSMLATKRG